VEALPEVFQSGQSLVLCEALGGQRGHSSLLRQTQKDSAVLVDVNPVHLQQARHQVDASAVSRFVFPNSVFESLPLPLPVLGASFAKQGLLGRLNKTRHRHSRLVLATRKRALMLLALKERFQEALEREQLLPALPHAHAGVLVVRLQ